MISKVFHRSFVVSDKVNVFSEIIKRLLSLRLEQVLVFLLVVLAFFLLTFAVVKCGIVIDVIQGLSNVRLLHHLSELLTRLPLFHLFEQPFLFLILPP